MYSETMTTQAYSVFLKILENENARDIAKYLNVATGTVTRWLKLKKVPSSYLFGLMRLAKMDINYTQFSYKAKDQFFTPVQTTKYCFEVLKSVINQYGDSEDKYTFIEPSAGSGNFLGVLPEDRTIALDIEPRCDKIISANFLTWFPQPDNQSKKYIVFGNPPFGLRGQLALQFINHSSTFSDYVCFILPQLFSSDGKGVPRKRVMGLNLIHSEPLKTAFIDPDGKSVKVNCILQVWSKFHQNPEYEIQELDNDVLTVYSLSDGGTPSTTRNKAMFDKCDIYLPSTCFGKKNMRWFPTFNDLPRRRGYGVVFHKEKERNVKKFKALDWGEVAFLSTNSAYNVRRSQIAGQFANEEEEDESSDEEIVYEI